MSLSLELMRRAMTSYRNVSRFLSKKPSTLYQTCPAKCLTPNSIEDILGRE